MTLGKERSPEDTLLEQLPFWYSGPGFGPNMESRDMEAQFYYKRDWSEAGGNSCVDADYLAFPFSVPRELVKRALQSSSHEATVRVEGEHRVHKEAWHYWSDHHTGGRETSESMTIEFHLQITEKGPVLSIHDPFQLEFFSTPENTRDAGRPGTVYRAIRWNSTKNAYELLFGRHIGGYSGETSIDTITFEDPLTLTRAIGDLQREGVAIIQVKGELKHFVQLCDHSYDQGDWWDKEDATLQSGEILCELRVINGSLAPFTPTVKIENSP